MKPSHRVPHPSAAFAAALSLGIAPFLIPGYWDSFGVFALCLILGFAAGHGWTLVKTVRRTLLILALFMLVIRSAFGGGERVIWQWGSVAFTHEAINSALTMASGVLALGTSLLLFFTVVGVRDITTALEDAGMPRSASYVVLSAMQMIPEMRARSARILDAQKTRGVETEGSVLVRAKAFVPTLGPLVLSALTETEERVLTLESRAFTAPVRGTRLHELTKTRGDRAITALALCALLAAFALRMFLWLR